MSVPKTVTINKSDGWGLYKAILEVTSSNPTTKATNEQAQLLACAISTYLIQNPQSDYNVNEFYPDGKKLANTDNLTKEEIYAGLMIPVDRGDLQYGPLIRTISIKPIKTVIQALLSGVSIIEGDHVAGAGPMYMQFRSDNTLVYNGPETNIDIKAARICNLKAGSLSSQGKEIYDAWTFYSTFDRVGKIKEAVRKISTSGRPVEFEPTAGAAGGAGGGGGGGGGSSSAAVVLPPTLALTDYSIKNVDNDGWCLNKAFLTPFKLDSSENALKLACIVADKIENIMTTDLDAWQNIIGVPVMADETAELPAGLNRTVDGKVTKTDGTDYMGVATQEPAGDRELYILVGVSRRKFIKREEFIKSITTLRTPGNIDSGPIAYPESQVFFQALNKIHEQIRVIFYKQEGDSLNLKPLFFEGDLNGKLFIFIRHDGNHFDYIERTAVSALPTSASVPFDQEALNRLYSSSTCARTAAGGAGGSPFSSTSSSSSGGAGGSSSSASGGAGGSSSSASGVMDQNAVVSRASAIIQERKEKQSNPVVGTQSTKRKGSKGRKTIELSLIPVKKTAADILAEISPKLALVSTETAKLEPAFLDLCGTVINEDNFSTLTQQFITLDSDIANLIKYYKMLTATDDATVTAKANIVSVIQASFKLDKLIKLFGITVDIIIFRDSLAGIVEPTDALSDIELKSIISKLQSLLGAETVRELSEKVTTVTLNPIGDITVSLAPVEAALEALRTISITEKYNAAIIVIINRVRVAANAAVVAADLDTSPFWENYDYIAGLGNDIPQVPELQTALKALQTRVFTAKIAATEAIPALLALKASITAAQVTDADALQELVLRKVCTVLLATANRINDTLAGADDAAVTAATAAIEAIPFADYSIRVLAGINTAKIPKDPAPADRSLAEQQEQARDAFMKVKFNIEFRRRQLMLATITANLVAITGTNITAAADSAALEAIDARFVAIQSEYITLMNTSPTYAELESFFNQYTESTIVALPIPTDEYGAQVTRLTAAITAKRETLADAAIVEIEAAVTAYMAAVETAATQVQIATIIDLGNPINPVIARATALMATLAGDRRNRVETAIFKAKCSIALAHLKENRRDLEAIAAPTQFRTAAANVGTATAIYAEVTALQLPDLNATCTVTTDPYSAAYLVRESCLATADSIKTINEVASKKFALDVIVTDYERFQDELQRLYDGARVATRNAVIAEAKSRSLDISIEMPNLQGGAGTRLNDIQEAVAANQTLITALPAVGVLQAATAAAQAAVDAVAGGTVEAKAAAAIVLKNAQNAQIIANTKLTAFERIGAQVAVYRDAGEIARRRLEELTVAITTLCEEIDHIIPLAGVFDFNAPTPADMRALSTMRLTVAMLPTKGKKAVTAPAEITRLNGNPPPLLPPLTAVALAKKRLMGL